MGFSVVGLPHYTIWHLYEPSVDDIKHMEVRLPHTSTRVPSHLGTVLTVRLKTQQEMEKEKKAAEAAERQKAEEAKKMKETFGDGTGQWEKDKAGMQAIAQNEQLSPKVGKGLAGLADEKFFPAKNAEMAQGGKAGKRKAGEEPGSDATKRDNKEPSEADKAKVA